MCASSLHGWRLSLLRKYFKAPRLWTRESFLRYIEKWVLLSTVLGLLTGIVVALFDYVTNLKLWTYFSALFSHNPLLAVPFVLAALLFSGLMLTKSSTPMGSGTEEVVNAYNNTDQQVDVRSFPQKMLAAIVTIGLGGSAGQEGPSVYAGGVVGSWIWGRFRRVGLTAVLGLISGVAGLIFIFFYKSLERLGQRLKSSFLYKAMIGGSVVSVIGIVSVSLYHIPYPLGISYDLINLALTPNTLTSTLLVLFVMKLIATSFTLGTTGVGGIFIPQIVMGASLGGLFGEAFFPSRLDLFVAVGMSSFLAAGYKTPLASVAFVAETTSGLGYLIPSLVAAAVSYSVSGEASVSEYQKLRAEIDITQISHLDAKDVMSRNVVAILAELSVLDFLKEYLFRYQYKSFPVVDKNGLLGTLALEDIKSTPREKRFEVKVADVCNRIVSFAYPSSRLEEVLDLIYRYNLGIIPIVDRANPKRIVGIISKTDIMRAIEKQRLGA